MIDLPSAQQNLQQTCNQLATDCISRQVAISAICNACGKIDCDKMDKCEKLQLSPANISETPNSSDTISRQQAIDALDKRFDNVPMELTTEILQLRRDLRERIPSAQPERKTGKWIYNSPVTMKCNQCGLVIKDWDWHRFKICPNCGADMRGEQDG